MFDNDHQAIEFIEVLRKARLMYSEDIENFLGSVPAEHEPTFTALRDLILELVPEAEVSLKWGTIAYNLGGSLFALSANKKHVNLYILTIGLLAEYSEALAGIPQSKCVLRFAPGAELPMETLRDVMATAVERAMG